jgi:hypothetical protein
MTTLILMCGLPGAGKTTLARSLERERDALRLTPDDWILALGIDPYDEPQRAVVEQLQWDVAMRALELGTSVILDFGFWSRRERDDFRVRASALGVGFEIHFVDASRDELLARLLARNATAGPGDVLVDAEALDRYTSWFEPPAPDEFAILGESDPPGSPRRNQPRE